MKPSNEVKVLVEARRKRLGLSAAEVALATVGSPGTWNARMNNPLEFKYRETQRLFRCLDFSPELMEQFNEAMYELGEET